MKNLKVKFLSMLILIFLGMITTNCKRYMSISKPDRNNESIVVGYLDAVYFGMYPRMWVFNTKTGKMTQLEVVEK